MNVGNVFQIKVQASHRIPHLRSLWFASCHRSADMKKVEVVWKDLKVVLEMKVKLKVVL